MDMSGRTRGARELVAVLFAGLVHLVTELLVSEPAAVTTSVVFVVIFAGYLVRRVRAAPETLRAWGMRVDNLRACLPTHFAFTALGAVFIVGYGWATDAFPLPWTFWLVLALYPLWGVAQQFGLQNLLAGNLAPWIRRPLTLAVVTAAMFSAAHYPRMSLVTLTLISGIGFVLTYRRAPNLWLVGLSHGVLATMAVYLVLHADPGAAIVDWLTRS